MQEPSSSKPLFYDQPVALTATLHGDWRLLPGNATFAADTPAIPLTLGEFASAAASYPVLFATGNGADVSPIALTGLRQINLFVEDGRWSKNAYVPAYVRRYPFVPIQAGDGSGGFALGIDGASALVAKSGTAGEPLFADGKPTQLTGRALEFCRLFGADHGQGRALCAALVAQDLLVDRQADATLPDGRKLAVSGFKVVDAERFAALPDEQVLAWHRAGWLAPIHFHLASLERFAELLGRERERGDKASTQARQPATPGARSTAEPGRSRTGVEHGT